ncbi:hypothetical protein EDD22DRAFT_859552 [Suillus occidentalis]|nr:hypothetical protein EDD22DRAFT_859552 [Suillus occidentalis]
MSWLRRITSAALSSTARGVFPQRSNLPARMLSNVPHPPALLDRTKEQDRHSRSCLRLISTCSGRRIYVADNQLGESFRRLQTRLRRNRLIQEVSRQRRHEKKGVKRRRLSSERWRRMFANEVRKKVQLVSTIRRRGAY